MSGVFVSLLLTLQVSVYCVYSATSPPTPPLTTTPLTTPPAMTPSPPTTLAPCKILGQDEEQKWAALMQRFPQGKRPLNFVFLVDRSKSIYNNGAYNQSVQFALDLMTYLTRTRRIYIHPDYARVAIISFANTLTTEFEGITSSSRAASACDINERLTSLYREPLGEEGSKLSLALNETARLFTARDLNSQENSNIVWIFNDGEDSQVTSTLSPRDVRFVVGVGAWLDKSQEANVLESLGSDKDHVACVDVWSRLVTNMTPQVPEGKSVKVFHVLCNSLTPPVPEADTVPVYAVSQDSHCSDACTEETQCACDVIRRNYTCQKCVSIEDCSEGDDSDNGEDSEEEEGLLDKTWFIIVLAAGGATVLALILMIVLVTVYCKRRKNQSEPPVSPPSAKAVQAPRYTSSLPPGTRLPPAHHPLAGGPTTLPAQVKTNHPPSRLPPSVPRGTPPTRPAPAPPLPPRSVNAKPQSDPDVPGRMQEDYVNIELQEPYENVKVGQNEDNMEGWAEYLEDTKQTNKLNGIFVHTVRSQPDKHSAWTSGFKISPTHQLQIEKSLEKSRRPQSIKIGGATYILDKDTTSQLNFHASRRKSTRTSLSEDLFAGVIAGYVIVVTTDSVNRDDAEKVFYEIQRHLVANQGTENNNTENKEQYENMEFKPR